MLRLYDMRANVPLYKEEVHQGKILSSTWYHSEEETAIITGGSDCCLKATRVQHI
jgi:hypothetical protein